MKLIESKVEIIPQGMGLDGVHRQIELAGRTCYKSEDKITSDSAKGFVEKMISSGHTAMLEHGTVYLMITYQSGQSLSDSFVGKYRNNKYSKVKVLDIFDGPAQDHMLIRTEAYITTNLRVIVENNWLDDLRYICEPTEYHERRISVRFTCDRGVSHELVRHRVFSFAQESTRYCNYSRDKFGNELTFIIPSWMALNSGEYSRELTSKGVSIVGDGYYADVADIAGDKEALFIYHLLTCENRYLSLLDMGWTPQQARQVLPNALKTEVVMTGFMSDWEHFFELRCAENVHPDMRKLAVVLKDKLYDKS